MGLAGKWTLGVQQTPTLLLQLLQQLVMLPAQLRPLGELVLAAGRIQVVADGQVFFLLLSLIGELFG
jgi:hypothetical protein